MNAIKAMRSYRGPRLHGRWQVGELGSDLGHFTIYDNKLRGFIKDKTGRFTRYFTSVVAAENHVAVLAGAKPSPKLTVVKRPSSLSSKRSPSAASMFRDLILANDLSDDEIFAQVQTKFGLADNRRSYVEWYRKDLKKKGLLE